MDQLLSFKAVHAIQTSTRTLAAVLRPENPEIAVFPNAVFELPEIRNFTNPGCLTLFFGALNRQDDWQPLLPALNAVAQTAGAKLQFSVVHDRGFFDALETPHLFAIAGRGGDRLHAARRYRLQSGQIRSEIH
jgi:hypothetical protein